MRFSIHEMSGEKYIRCVPSDEPICSERQALDLLGACCEYDVGRIMLPDGALGEAFFRLGTGVAGAILQKLTNYQTRVAIVIEDETAVKGKFREFITECNRGGGVHFFQNEEAAAVWLAGQ